MRMHVVALMLIFLAGGVGAEPARVTVVTKQGRHGGTLSVEQVEIETAAGGAGGARGARAPAGRGVVKVPMADIASVFFGEVDSIRTRAGKRHKGVISVEGWTLADSGEQRPLSRQDLRFIVPQIKLGAPRKGQIADAAAANGMTYHVRVPEQYDPAKGKPAIVFLHGSNANSADYLKGITQRWPKVAADYVLIGINGEWPNYKDPDAPASYNFTYVNFVGKSKYKGFPGTDRESPALVAEVVAEIREQLKLTKVYVTGHSQGGFLSYSCLMNYPEVFAGAMPISAGLIFQCEPTAYTDAAIRKAQRQRALVIVHGEKDPLVGVGMAKAAHESFLGDGFPMLRLLLAREAAHMFIALPFEEGIRWLESMTADDAKVLVASAERAVARKEYRDALAYLDRAKQMDSGGANGQTIAGLSQKIEQLAAAPAKSLEAAIDKNADGTWVAEFDAFRRQYEFTDSARGVMERYARLRAEHEPLAEKRWGEARKAFGDGNREEGYRICEEIVAKHYASSFYRYAKQTLADRKP